MTSRDERRAAPSPSEAAADHGGLEAKLRELEALNDDLNNLLTSTEIAALFLDSDLRIRRATPGARAILGASADDGLPLEGLVPQLHDPQLLGDARRVLETGESLGAEVRTDGERAFIRRILPYRTSSRLTEGVVLTLGEVTGLRRMTDQLGQRARQQEAVVLLGRIALAGAPLERLFEQAVRLLAERLDCGFAAVLERLPDGDRLLLRSGIGWQNERIGTATIPTGRESHAGHALESGGPVIVSDLTRERRFSGGALLREHGVVSGIGVPLGLEEEPWGVLSVHDDRPRAFNSDDVGFVQSVATLLFVAIERRRRLRELERTAQRLRLALDGAGMGTWEWDLAEGAVTLDRHAWQLLGLPPEPGPVSLDRLAPLIRHEDRRRTRRALVQARREGELHWPELAIASDRWGGQRWIGVRGRSLVNGKGTNGRSADGRMIGVLEDVTSRKQEQSRREMLMAELDHRVKNILANVNAIARQTGRRHQDAGEFIATLEGRIRAMADAHSLLAATRWAGANLRILVESELAPYASSSSDRIAIEGRDLMLTPRAAQSFSLALHELATNAIKYGALSHPEGRVSVQWRLEEAGDARTVRFEWHERDGPAPPADVIDGFGMTVLKRMVPKDLAAQIRLELAPEGLVYEIAFPLAEEARQGSRDPAEAAWSGLPGSPGSQARGRTLKILVVEDAWALGEQLRTILELLGHQAVGPASTLAEGLALAELGDLDAAILDVRIGQQTVFPVAARLAERRIPFGFASGYQDEPAIPAAFKDRPAVNKPFAEGNIRSLVDQLLRN